MERVKGMEKFFLGLLLASDELDVVYDQEINGAVNGTEALGPLLAEGAYEIVGKFFRAAVEHAELRTAP